MNIYQITFFLSRSCLGEISDNFRRIYFSVDKNILTLYFLLREKNEDDLENIQYEILSNFEMLLEDEYEDYIVNYEIIIGDEKYLKDSDFNILVEFYRKKENY
ncbi:hypothetical protein ACG9XR_09215 [Acinetobacter guillouiae]|uniref:hypothetical protein n=1 Tax=Acinetobacter guillouiae TaxID=106649 RepID=UPI003AF51411